MAARLWALWLVVTCTSGGCAELQAIDSGIAASERHARATAARFDLDVVVSCAPAGEPRFTPCAGELELVLTNTRTHESARARVPQLGALGGALPAGEYEIALGIDGMQVGLSAERNLGRVQLDEGQRALGTLRVRFVELPAGSFREQAIDAERVRAAYDLSAADLLRSPTRGLLLLDARLEGSET